MAVNRVVVTGFGIVSGLGIGTQASWGNLLKKMCGIRALEQPGFASLSSRIAAVIDEAALQSFIDRLFTRSDLRSMSRSSVLSVIAAEEALRQAAWQPSDAAEQNRTGVSFGVSLDNLWEIHEVSLKSKEKGLSRALSPFFMIRLLSNMPAAHISMRYKFRGPQHCPSAACATGSHAIGDGFRIIQRGGADVMVCGGAEAAINPLAMAAFCKLRALSCQNDSPATASRPFDAGRDGFVFAEGAGAVVMESLAHAEARGATPIAEVLGYGSTGDAHHFTAPSPDGDGAFRCMSDALSDASLAVDAVGLINAHATSTPLGDRVESEAIARLTGGRKVQVTANKGATGHVLSASGAIEAIFTALSCSEAIIPPTLNLDKPDTHPALDYVTENRQWEAGRRVALSNSFGFGGVNSCLCIGQFVP